VLLRQLNRIRSFTPCGSNLYTAFENNMGPHRKLSDYFQYTVAAFFLFALWLQPVLAQDAAQKPVEERAAKSGEKTVTPEKAVNPAQIELLETKVRFETNGDSSKEVHALVKINNELGVRQFAKLNSDYNRSFESIEIPLVHITHASRGTADILPSAITDQPNPAVVDAPAYQDVRVKSVRILGLEPGDTLEYRVITTVTHHPLAPDFWLDHSFDRTGVVTKEIFELDLPASRPVQKYVNPKTPVTSTNNSGEGNSARTIFRWSRSKDEASPAERGFSEPDVVLTTYDSWDLFIAQVAKFFTPSTPAAPEIYAKALAIIPASSTNDSSGYNPSPKIEALYDFVSQKIRTVDLPLGATGLRTRPPAEILSSGYATPEDKLLLFAALASDVVTLPHALLIASAMTRETGGLARPSVFDHLLTEVGVPSVAWWVDLNLEVAPYGMIPSQFREKRGLFIAIGGENHWHESPQRSFPGLQRVSIEARLGADGKLTAKVHYSMRGDNELLLRVAFHQSSKERWKELAQLLSITDGFRGQVTSVEASDPYATKEPFTLEYEIEQPKFVNWSKKTVRIPALLPQIGLPDPPAKPAAGAAVSPIELGTPLEVETQMTLHLPAGTTVHSPTGTSVQRDYAAYASQYSAKGLTITASRHINFLLRKIPADRAADYGAFLHAVQNDEAQDFTLEQANPAPTGAKPAESKTPSPN
jgi:hypothetical protein